MKIPHTEEHRPFRVLALALVALLSVSVACGRPEPPPVPEPDPDSLRSTRTGDVVGFESPAGAHAWRGIPFATPPVGELRWRAPRPPEAWEGVRESLEFGASCVQFAGLLGGDTGAEEGDPIGDEDCLYLNVFAPPRSPEDVAGRSERLPVMFWIHGGGNTIGDTRFYDGSRLALEHQLVVVTVQYRLGVFGWFAHPALPGEGATPEDRSRNFGTLDLVRALEWVRGNIAAFGGDPERVTIFGESAGGRNVFSLLLSPRARGLFQRAIVQSGATTTTPMAEATALRDDPRPGHAASSGEVILRLLQRDGGAGDRAAAKAALASMQDSELRVRLRGESAYALLGLYEGNLFGGMYRMPQLLRDGFVLPKDEPLRVLAAGDRHNRVPVILGTNRDENKLFLLFSSPFVTRVARIPLWLNDERRYQLDADYASLMWKAAGVDEPAAAMRASQGPSVFAYRFDWDEEPKILFADLSKMLGAAHGLEIPFIFGRLTFPRAGRFIFPEDRLPAGKQLSRAMMSYWAQFAATGDPGRGVDGQLPRWTPWDDSSPKAPRFILLDTEEGGGLRMSPDSVTLAGVIRRVAEDSRFESWEERCEVYRGFVEWGNRMSREQYAEVGDGACRAHPLE
jgi:para-nitrobenzyl esterase